MSASHKGAIAPANDNFARYKPLGVEVEIPRDLPIQIVEVEVLAKLLDSLPANDNGEPE